MNTQTTYFPALTGLRAVAAYAVFVHHFAPPFIVKYEGLHKLSMELHIGVTLFFVLSGFLITYQYGTADWNDPKNWKSYLQNRWARIYPVYFLLLTLTFAGGFYLPTWTTQELWATYLLSLFFLHGFFDDLRGVFIPQSWSLTAEECFYLLAPLIFYFYRQKNIKLWLQFLLFTAIGVALVAFFSKHIYYGFFSNYQFLWLHTFFGRSAEFLVGVGFAFFFKQQATLLPNKHHFKTYLGLILIAICLINLALLQQQNSLGLQHPAGICINNWLLPFAIICFLWGLLTEKTVVQTILSSKLLVILGKSSYLFYLLHKGLLERFLLPCLQNYYFLTFLALNALSVLLFYAVEQPLHKRLRKKFDL